MPDVLANRTFGRDDGIECHACGSKTYLSFDQGRGLCSYNCENCDNVTQVQYDYDDESDYVSDDYYEPPYDIYAEN